MKRFPYRIMVEWSERNECYFSRVPALPGLGADGATAGEAVDEAQVAAEAMIQELAFKGLPIPPPDHAESKNSHAEMDKLNERNRRQAIRDAAKALVSAAEMMVSNLREEDIPDE